MGKRDFCLCKNKGADQLCNNCTADLRLCLRYTASAASSLILRVYRQDFCVGPGRKPRIPVFSLRGSNNNLSRLVRKPTICIGENKGADQLRGNREADQRL